VAAYQLGMLSTFLPGFLLSGFVFSIDTMPKAIQAISIIVPARYFVTIIKSLFLKGVGLEVLWAQLVYLLIFAVIVFRLSVRKLNQKVA
jgi:ABC-2 type transport system permease protein